MNGPASSLSGLGGLFSLEGRVALVTGGSRGIGRGIALGLSQAGASVALAARDLGRAEAVARELELAGGKALAVQCDVTADADLERAVRATRDAFGGIDVLVNNAGIAEGGAAQSISPDRWHRVIDTNLTAVFRLSQCVYPELRARGGGKIINLASEYSLFGSAFVVPYAASKGGVVQLTKSLAVAWAHENIQVNAILPGWIRTDMTAPVEQMAEFSKQILARTPAGRFGETWELAGAAVFLASRASDFVTGAILPVDGGYASA